MRRSFTATLLLALSSCSEPALNFTADAVESLPQQADLSGGLSTGQSIAGQLQLASFFKQECHMYPDDDFCPKGIDAAAKDGKNSWKFSVTTLLGLVYHAEMYTGGKRSRCAGRAATISSSSFVSASGGGDPDRYILDDLSVLECLEDATGSASTPSYRAYSIEPDFQATLTTRHKATASFVPAPMTDVFQVDVSVDRGGAPTFLAFNWAGVSTMYGRAVLLVNLKTHRFAVKYLTGPASSAHHVSAIGVGGVDRATGAARPGYYSVRYTDEKGMPLQSCVENATQLFEVDDTECARTEVPTTWTTSDAVASYLELTPAEQSRLAAFVAMFATPAPLGVDETPGAAGDADLYFPVRMQ